MRAGKSFSLMEKLGRAFSSQVWLAQRVAGGPIKQRSSRCVSVAAHLKSCACWRRFFLNGDIWPGFPSSVLVGVDNLGTTVYSIAWLSFPWTTSWGGCRGTFLGTRRAFPVGGLPVGKRGKDRLNPGETCLPAYSGELVLGKTSVLLSPRALAR